MSNSFEKKYDVVYVNTREVSCDGGDSFSGHPKVYLKIKEELMTLDNDNIHADFMAYNHVVCPYCGKFFVYKDANSK